MANTQSATVKVNGTFSILLTLFFVFLKVTGVIAWSWIWILAPLWIPFILATLIFLVVVIVAATVGSK